MNNLIWNNDLRVNNFYCCLALRTTYMYIFDRVFLSGQGFGSKKKKKLDKKKKMTILQI